jgi:hypothetical protein
MIIPLILSVLIGLAQFVIGIILIISSIVKRKSPDLKLRLKGGLLAIFVCVFSASPAISYVWNKHIATYEYQFEHSKKVAERKNLEWVNTTCTSSHIIAHFLYKGEEYVGFRYVNYQYLGVDTKNFKTGKLVATAYHTQEAKYRYSEAFGKIYEVNCGYDIPILVFYPDNPTLPYHHYYVKVSDFDRAMDILPKESWWLEEYSPDEIKELEDYYPLHSKDCAMNNEQ